MRVQDWTRALARTPRFTPILDHWSNPCEYLSVPTEVRPVVVATCHLERPRKTLIVCASHERALHWQARLELCGVPREHIVQLPSGLSALFEDAAPEHTALSDRIGALRALVESDPKVIIATASSALERTLPVEVLESHFIHVKAGDEVSSDDLMDRLAELGYERQEPVREPGQFSRRGGILDVFAMGRDFPLRIEFFGDEVESIRAFDPVSQRSVESVGELRLAPSRETVFPSGATTFAEMLETSARHEGAALEPAAAQRLEELVADDARALDDKVFFDRLDLYRPLLHPDSGCAVDLLGDGLLVLDEPLELESIGNRAYDELASALEARHRRGEILFSTAGDFMLTVERFGLQERVVSLSAMNALPDWLKLTGQFDLNASTLEPYRGRAEALTLAMQNWKQQGLALFVSTEQPHRAKSVLAQVEVFPIEDRFEFEQPLPQLIQGNLSGGFVAPDLGFAVVTDAELFGVRRLRLPQKRFREGAPIATVLDLKPGDYVVHIQHGIGVFRGLITRESGGVQKEYLFIEYVPPDKLFVPADQLDRVQKFLNPADTVPKINRLSGTEWQKTIRAARDEARKFARDLVALYAKRKQAQRPGFGPDTPFQAEMEGTFPWVETPTQLQAITDVKTDLALDYPMDRLVCGDVGFGKTEVAIRAAFKVIQAGKQVAVLCPTTILSEQHYRNFEERLGPFGTKLALLNRFQTGRERTEILQRVKDGDIEIVIGTHALLSKEIAFKNLGILIIDEEHKFGVKQKELLKELRVNVDVLTLSATPIPRTLSMALMDIREMSLITDPPPGRLPIRTFLRPYSKEVVREAILRELARGGQVYYVYNRVQGIEHVAERLGKMVPMARIGVGHGQMNEKELEPIMVGFVKGELDILLSTTIIESGLDIPNANTLIVEDADRLGLAQLYQLRGRVGRSDVQAYAYLLYQSAKELTENALSRLQALQEFSSLGAGYSLAFRDLQIRGAGELLGAKQHGTMATVGYELYTQLIAEQVAALKNAADGVVEEVKDPLESLTPLPAFDLPVTAFVPEWYVQDQAQRLYVYQQMMSSRDLDRLAEVQAEVEDRYGQAPAEVARAFAVMRVRMRGRDVGFEKVDGSQGRLAVTFKDRTKVPPRIISLLNRRYKPCYLTRDVFVWPFTGDALSACERLLDEWDSCMAELEAARALLP